MFPFTWLEHVDQIPHPDGKAAAQITVNGEYTNYSNEVVSIKDETDYSVLKTKTFPPEVIFTLPPEKFGNGYIEVSDEDSVSCARRLTVEGKHKDVVILNFANPVEPGGGWARGAYAQEENLCRASSLYKCLIKDIDFYKFNDSNIALSSHYLIYSPFVPFFKNGALEFLNRPFKASVITSSAVIVPEVEEGKNNLIYKTMYERCKKIICLAASQGHRVLLLGAFGCGAFFNDPEIIAAIFKNILIDDDYRSYFDIIQFPIPEFMNEIRSKNIDPFANILQVPITRYK